MPCGGDEVEADVDPGVVEIKETALDLQLLLKVILKLAVDVVDDGLVAEQKQGRCSLASRRMKAVLRHTRTHRAGCLVLGERSSNTA